MSKSKVEATSRRARGDPPTTVRSDEGQRLGEYHRGRAEAHLAAAVASERGEMVHFARDCRAEPPEEEQCRHDR